MSRTHIPLKALTGLVRNLNSDVKALKKSKFSLIHFVNMLMIECSEKKKQRKLSEEIFFGRKKKNPGLSANRPLNNYAL